VDVHTGVVVAGLCFQVHVGFLVDLAVSVLIFIVNGDCVEASTIGCRSHVAFAAIGDDVHTERWVAVAKFCAAPRSPTGVHVPVLARLTPHRGLVGIARVSAALRLPLLCSGLW